MALVTKNFTLNVTPGEMPPTVHVSEYDIGRTYTITLLGENGSAFEIPTDTTATVEGTLNGTVGFTTSATISGNQISFALTESMTAYAGKAWCKIKLTQNSQPIQTCAFILAVDRAGVEADTVIGADGFEEQIAEAAAEWLEEQGFSSPTIDVTEITGGHRVTVTDYEGSESFDVMDGEDTGVVTDTTLTVSGAAADSKTVGTVFAGLANRVYPKWESGTFYYITVGNLIQKYTTETYEKTRKRTSFKVSLGKGTISCSSDYQFNALLTDDSETIVDASGYVSRFEITDSNIGDYNILIKSSSNADISSVDPNEIITIAQSSKIDEIEKTVDTTNEKVAEISLDFYGGDTNAEFIPSSRFAAQASNRIENKIARPVVGNTLNTVTSTGGNVFFFDLGENVDSITFPILVTTEGNGSAFLDSNGVVVQSLIYTTGHARDLVTVDKPSNAVTFALSYYNSWINNYPDVGVTFHFSGSVSVEGVKQRVADVERTLSELTGALKNVRPVPRSTANAMLKCAYTYVDACRSGSLVYGDGTGTSQRAGTICCSTFCRQLLQGIPYNDYLPANASRTTKSGKKWRYGYRLNKDYYADDATTTAQQMYNQHYQDGRAFETDFDLEGAEPGDLVVFGDTITSVSHIAMFCFRDSEGKAWLIDSSTGNTGIAIRLRPQWEVNGIGGRNPVGIIRPDLTAVDLPVEDIPVTAESGTITWQMLNGYGHFLLIEGDVTANQAVQYGSDISFTPAYSGKDIRIMHIPAFADGTDILTYSGLSNIRCTLRHYLF